MSRIIVSMTTIPSRIPGIYKTINSIKEQTVKVDQIYICVPHISAKESVAYAFPQEVLSDCEIVWLEEDYGPICKILGILREPNEETIIITMDDDVVYSNDIVEKLLEKSRLYPNSAIGSSGLQIGYFPYYGGIVIPQAKSMPQLDVPDTGLLIDIIYGYAGCLYYRKFFPEDPTELLGYAKQDRNIFLNDDVLISALLDYNNIPRRIFKLNSFKEIAEGPGLSSNIMSFTYKLYKAIRKCEAIGLLVNRVPVTSPHKYVSVYIISFIFMALIILAFKVPTTFSIAIFACLFIAVYFIYRATACPDGTGESMKTFINKTCTHFGLSKPFSTKSLEYKEVDMVLLKSPTIPADYTQKIPLYIFQKYEKNKVPKGSFDNSMTLIRDNPEYTYEYFDNEKVEQFISTNFNNSEFDELFDNKYQNVCLTAYHKLIPGAFKADLFRYLKLYLDGGVYIDMGTISMSPLKHIIAPSTDILLVKDMKFKDLLQNSMIACLPKHQTMRDAIIMCLKNIIEENYTDQSIGITGPAVLTKVVKSNPPANVKYIEWHKKLLCVTSVYKDGNTILYTIKNKRYRDEQSHYAGAGYDELWSKRKVFNT